MEVSALGSNGPNNCQEIPNSPDKKPGPKFELFLVDWVSESDVLLGKSKYYK